MRSHSFRDRFVLWHKPAFCLWTAAASAFSVKARLISEAAPEWLCREGHGARCGRLWPEGNADADRGQEGQGDAGKEVGVQAAAEVGLAIPQRPAESSFVQRGFA
jgi:hypothetical protein